MTTRRTGAEIIGIHLSSDIKDIQAARYQPTRYVSPAIYSIGDYYFASPVNKRALPKEWIWREVGEYHGRKVFRAHMNDDVADFEHEKTTISKRKFERVCARHHEARVRQGYATKPWDELEERNREEYRVAMAAALVELGIGEQER